VNSRSVLIALVMAGVATCGTLAEASDTDWKLFGVSTVNGNEDLCFFDIKGAVQAPDKHIKVWTKCLHKTAMDGIDIEKDFGGKIVSNAVRR
jgi:hypothetical protein